MKSKKIFLLIFFLLAVIQIPIILFLGNTKAAAFDLDFQEKEFAKYDPPFEDRLEIASDLLFYLRVRNALYVSTTIFIASILILLILDKKKAIKKIGLSAVLGGFLTSILSLIFYLIVMIDFDVAFTKFHHIFFKLGNWQFPPDYMLVQLYPAQFWTDIIDKIITNVIITTIIVIILGILLFGLYLYKEKKAVKFFRSKEGIIYKIKNI